MTTLREAAQAVLDRWDSPRWEWSTQGPTADLMADLRAALAEPVHEEVYWYVGTDGKYYSSNEVKLFMDANTKGLHLDPPQWRKDKGDLIPLYTAPPQQPDPDRIHSCSYHCMNPACIKAQRDELRDKLFGEKNERSI